MQSSCLKHSEREKIIVRMILELRNNWDKRILLISSLLFLVFSYFQQAVLNTIAPIVMTDFFISKTQLGLLGSVYFLGNFVFLIPAGILLDRINVKYILLIVVIIAIISNFMFAITDSLYIAFIAKFICGICSAFSVITVIKVATLYFRDKVTFITGMAYMSAMIGGMLAQKPFDVVASQIGWRQSLMFSLIWGFLILFLTLVTKAEKQLYSSFKNKKLLLLKRLNRKFFSCAMFAALLNLPIAVLGSLWGKLFFTHYYRMEPVQAAYLCSLLFVGMACGGVSFGLIFDRKKLNKAVLILFPVCLGILIILLLERVNVVFLDYIVFFIGFLSSIQIISYSEVYNINPSKPSGVSSSVVSLSIIGASVMWEPLYGYMVYRTTGFYFPTLLLSVVLFLAIIPTFFAFNNTLFVTRGNNEQGNSS